MLNDIKVMKYGNIILPKLIECLISHDTVDNHNTFFTAHPQGNYSSSLFRFFYYFTAVVKNIDYEINTSRQQNFIRSF